MARCSRPSPAIFDGLHLLGVVKYQRGEHTEALHLIEKALAGQRNAAEALAWSNYGLVLAALLRQGEAVSAYERALALNPNFVEALYNYATALQGQNRHEEALANFDRALALSPNYADALNNRSNSLRALERAQESLADCDRAIELRPDFYQAHYNRGLALMMIGRNAEALASFDRALALEPDFMMARLAACMAELPVIFRDETEIELHRAAYTGRLAELVARAHGPAAEKLADCLGIIQPFYLPYQGRNDRDLQSRYGELFCRVTVMRYPPADLPPPPAAGERVRVGIVSGYFLSHSNWKIPIRCWVSQLDREKFELFGYHTNLKCDADTNVAAAHFDRFVKAPLTIEKWREAILSTGRMF